MLFPCFVVRAVKHQTQDITDRIVVLSLLVVDQDRISYFAILKFEHVINTIEKKQLLSLLVRKNIKIVKNNFTVIYSINEET